MAHRSFWLGLWLAAAPLAAQLPNLSTYHSGTLHLELSQGQASRMGFDVKHLNEVICGVWDGESRGGGASRGSGVNPPGETCRLVIANDGGHNGRLGDGPLVALTASAQGLALSPCGPAQVTVQPTGLRLKGIEPIELACGLWKFEAELASRSAASPSVVSLLPAPSGSPTGLFTGALALQLDVVYTYAGNNIELPPPPYQETRSMVLDVAGRWTVVQATPGAALPPGETNLALFADRDTVAETIWLKKAGCSPARSGCSCLCLEASAGAVAALNGLPSF